MTCSSARVVIVMGPSGAGKTTVGRLAARIASAAFYEGDDYHPAGNVAKMAAGMGLTNEERRPWIAAIGAAWKADGRPTAVVACSALNDSVRQMLREAMGEGIRFALLDVPEAELRRRLQQREGHYAGADLLQSQLAAMDACARLARFDGTRPHDDVARTIAALLQTTAT